MRCFVVIYFYFVIGVFCAILFRKEVYKNKITTKFRKEVYKNKITTKFTKGEIIWKKIKRIKKRMKI